MTVQKISRYYSNTPTHPNDERLEDKDAYYPESIIRI